MTTHATVPRLLPLVLLLALPAAPARDVSALPPRPGRDAGLALRQAAGATPEIEAATSGLQEDAAVRGAGADESWWENVSLQIERNEYSAGPEALGLQAPNRAQNLRTYFRNGGIEVLPRVSEDDALWRFTWQTASWGRPGSVEAVAADAKPRAQGTRVSYDHAGITEWYENGKAGLEQGFTVHVRPPGAGPLCLTGLLGGTLRAELTDAGALDLFDSLGARVLRYAALEVIDANGADVDARMSLHGDELAILIEDDGAAYPLTVDPLVTSPAWTADGDQASSYFARTVAGAGDVNGDGYSDVIVGAHLYDNGEANEGKAFVYLGSANGLALTAAWTAEGNQAGAGFGLSVAGAGDVNGDGYSDVIVGAPLRDGIAVDEGAVFVFHGSPSGLASTAAWTTAGVSGASAGDVNGDGYADVIIRTSYLNGKGGVDHQTSVYHGSATGLAVSAAWSAEGDEAPTGWSAGDVNGDAYSDVIVGYGEYDVAGGSNEGRVEVYHGSPSGLSTSVNWTAVGDQAVAQFGSSVASAGDVNGDGFADIIVGAPLHSNQSSLEGRAYLYFGSASGLAPSAGWTADSGQQNAYFATSVASAGDVNGDGYSDVIVGAYGYDQDIFHSEAGRMYVYLGSASGPALPASTIEGEQGSSFFGFSVASAGDVNGDGYSDVIVGAYGYSSGFDLLGRAYVYHGSGGGLALSAGWTIAGSPNDHLGNSVASAGDVNGDGFSDVIVGADFHDNGRGRVLVFHGSDDGLPTAADRTVDGEQDSASLGWSVAGAGDVNGDGYSDVIVGAPFPAEGGRAYVYHGSSGGLVPTAAWIAECDDVSAHFGRSVASAGDVNGDGYSDVIVGAPAYGGVWRGKAFVYLGSASGLASTAAWTAVPDGDTASFGWCVASGGDVNGDGFSDVIVGSPNYPDGGRAFVYLGSAGGVTPTAAWIMESGQDLSSFGTAVAAAGDVNGDGYSDVVVGAPYFNLDAGRAFVYQGSASGLAPSAAWTADGTAQGALFGGSVASAGDANGDGFSDVIVGAPWIWSDHQIGKAYAYLGSASGLAAVADWVIQDSVIGSQTGASVASAGDVNGDGFSDVIVGAPADGTNPFPAGHALVHEGNGGAGLARTPRQTRTDDSAPVALLGRSDSAAGVRLKALGRTPAGRGRARLQYEIKPLGTPFDVAGLVTGPEADTGVPGAGGSFAALSEVITGLTADTPYHWRLRILTDSPAAPRSPWFTMAGNAITETDLRTAMGATVDAPIGRTDVATLLLERPAPNPFGETTEIRYSLPARSPVQLAVYDVSGRRVTVLSSGVEEAGPHRWTWDGRDATGTRVGSGVYFVKLEHHGGSEVQKVVQMR